MYEILQEVFDISVLNNFGLMLSKVLKNPLKVTKSFRYVKVTTLVKKRLNKIIFKAGIKIYFI